MVDLLGELGEAGLVGGEVAGQGFELEVFLLQAGVFGGGVVQLLLEGACTGLQLLLVVGRELLHLVLEGAVLLGHVGHFGFVLRELSLEHGGLLHLLSEHRIEPLDLHAQLGYPLLKLPKGRLTLLQLPSHLLILPHQHGILLIILPQLLLNPPHLYLEGNVFGLAYLVLGLFVLLLERLFLAGHHHQLVLQLRGLLGQSLHITVLRVELHLVFAHLPGHILILCDLSFQHLVLLHKPRRLVSNILHPTLNHP